MTCANQKIIPTQAIPTPVNTVPPAPPPFPPMEGVAEGEMPSRLCHQLRRHAARHAPPVRFQWDALILDEAHFVKNNDTATYQAACRLRSRIRICLTGTPMEIISASLKTSSTSLSPATWAPTTISQEFLRLWVLAKALRRRSRCKNSFIRSRCAAPSRKS